MSQTASMSPCLSSGFQLDVKNGAAAAATLCQGYSETYSMLIHLLQGSDEAWSLLLSFNPDRPNWCESWLAYCKHTTKIPWRCFTPVVTDRAQTGFGDHSWLLSATF